MNYLSIIRNGVLAIAVLIAVVASTYQLSEAPAIWYDEGFYTQIGMNFAEGHGQALQVAPDTFVPTSYITVGFPLIMPLAASYSLFDVGVLQGRMVMVAFLLGFFLASFLLVRRLFGSFTAAWTALVLMTFPMLYGNGKSVLGEVPGLFFLVLGLLALHYLEKTEYKDWRGYVLLGVSAGLCAATKPFFILFLAALFITLIMRWRKVRLVWSYAALGFAALLLPLGLWAYLQFGAGTSLFGILAGYANPYGAENIPALIAKNALRFVTELTPFYTLIIIAVWSGALFLRRHAKKISETELAAYIFCLLAMLSYLRLEGWYRYLFPATTLALVYLPAAGITLFDFVKTKITLFGRVPWLPYAALLLLCVGQLYQVAYSSYVAQYYEGTRTRDMKAVLESIEPDKKVFLYNTPELAILLPSRNYYQFLSPLPQVTLGEHELAALTEGVADIVVVAPAAYAEHPALFKHYTLDQAADRYYILKKK